MKQFLIFILVVSVVVLIYAYCESQKIKVSSILFIGDSNTASATSYADQLQREFPNLVIKKIAQNGAKTDWMYAQLENELKKNSYSLVVILGGSNDIYALGQNDSAKINLDSMYRLSHNYGSKVIAVTPPSKNFYVNRTDKKQELLKNLVSFIKMNKNTDAVIDFYSLSNDLSYFSPADGYLHAGPAAHTVLKNKLKSKIQVQ